MLARCCRTSAARVFGSSDGERRDGNRSARSSVEEKRDGEKEGKTERDGVEKNDDWDAGDAAAEADEVRCYIEYFRAGILLPSGL
jgi:hypothetical protein